ncbi:MAG: polysaccharide biosynthesis protein [Oscillospiraceae bacterium]|nr:polysaccharide biosynthesis protein [Oscillospiraceae bacterium]
MQEKEKPNYLKGAAILAAASIFVKIIGAIYKIPLFQDGVLGDEGTGDFTVTYSVYTLILTISTAGVPAALSRLVSAAKAKGDTNLVKRYFSVALPAFALIGLIAMLAMLFFADTFAGIMNNTKAAPGIRVLAPAVFFACIIAVYRGYAQGFQNMIPTSMSQIIEVLSKAIFGIAAALWLVSLGYDSPIVSAGAIIGVTIGLGLCIPMLFWQKRKLDRQFLSDAHKNVGDDVHIVPKNQTVLAKVMKVSIPITLSASFMAVMVVIDNGIVLGRLQSSLGLLEAQARGLLGMYSRALAIYNLTPSLVVPVSISIIPAIAAALAKKNADEAKTIMQSSVKLVSLIAMPAAAGLMVLASPVLTALYNDQRELTSQIMVILAAASFFVCLQFVTTAILQANGYERVALYTFPVGAAVKITLSWFLAGHPSFGILASPIGTLVCFMVISTLNIIILKVKIKDNRPKLTKIFTGVIFCSAVMAGYAYAIYALLTRFLSDIFANARLEAIVFLSTAIITGIAVYGVLIIITRTVTKEDMKLLPKGEKLAKILRVR